jgi:hypothetical protein
MNFDYYKTPQPVAYRDEILAPVPGWGMTPNLAGPRIIGVGDASGMDGWWSRQSVAVKAAIMIGGVVVIGAAGAAVWEYMLRDKLKGKGKGKYESNDGYEENLSWEETIEKGKHVTKKVSDKAKMGYDAAKPHLKRGYEAAKPHLKRIAKGAKKTAKKATSAAAKKGSEVLLELHKRLEKKPQLPAKTS